MLLGRLWCCAVLEVLAGGRYAVVAAQTARAEISPSLLALVDVTVIDVRDGRELPGQTVVIVGNRIRALGPSRNIRIPEHARVVNASGKYLIPGLWDMHVHPSAILRPLPRDTQAPPPARPGALPMADVADLLFIANGVTGIRDAGSSLSLATLMERKQEIAAGMRVGPRQIVAGPAIADCREWVEGSKEWFQFFHHKICIATPAEARLVVDFLKASGADMLKTRGPRRELFFALAAEAARVGVPVGGHLSDSVTAEEASDSGQRILDHGNNGGLGRGRKECLPRAETDSTNFEQCAALAARLRRNGTWVEWEFAGWQLTAAAIRERQPYVPSRLRAVGPHDTGDVRQRGNEDLRLLERAGLPLLIGSDGAMGMNVPGTGIYGAWSLPGFVVHDHLARAVEDGLTPLFVLQAATLNPALAVGAGDSLGVVEVGKVADLLLLDGDPLANITNTRKIRAVVANGRYFDRAALDTLLAKAREEQ